MLFNGEPLTKTVCQFPCLGRNNRIQANFLYETEKKWTGIQDREMASENTIVTKTKRSIYTCFFPTRKMHLVGPRQ